MAYDEESLAAFKGRIERYRSSITTMVRRYDILSIEDREAAIETATTLTWVGLERQVIRERIVPTIFFRLLESELESRVLCGIIGQRELIELGDTYDELLHESYEGTPQVMLGGIEEFKKSFFGLSTLVPILNRYEAVPIEMRKRAVRDAIRITWDAFNDGRIEPESLAGTAAATLELCLDTELLDDMLPTRTRYNDLQDVRKHYLKIRGRKRLGP